MSADLELAFRLADAADRVSMADYRSADVLSSTKVDGTPVAEIDLAVEQAMQAIVFDVAPNDAMVGEEIGEVEGNTGVRWIFDGIDGTHNYAEGRPGWGTIVAVEVAGVIEVGVVSAPAYRRRWWAVRGGGAFTAEYDHGAFDPDAGVPMRVTDETDLDAATVVVMPWEGFLSGWRDELTRRFPLAEHVRSECLALDGARAAQGEFDVTLLTFGGLWDFAATSLMVTEAGGVFTDAWGGRRFDTKSAVFTNPTLWPQVDAVLAGYRPAEVDDPRMALNLRIQDGTRVYDPDDDAWRDWGIRPQVSMSAREHVTNAPPPVMSVVHERETHRDTPFVGVTTDGTPITGLRSLHDRPRTGTAHIAEAALAFLEALPPDRRERACFAVDAPDWRHWINVHMNHFRHGVMLEDLPAATRELALDILRATLSARGFHQARSIMRLNELLAEVSGDRRAFGEWPYFVSIFGEPGGDAPWGWQIDGHHLCVNAMIVDDRLVMTPTFMGAEPRRVHHGPYGGISLFDPEEQLGLDLIRAFDVAQRARAVIHPSLHPERIPMHLQNLFDGRMAAGAFHDNLVTPYQGIAGSDMTDAQRRVLLSLTDAYVGWSAESHAAVRREEVEEHLDETWFSWYGGTGDRDPFYYRVHSPVILIEFDHHPGVVFDNIVPTRYHVHTVVRTPNGGDYGTDLLREHHERFDHAHGTHRPH